MTNRLPAGTYAWMMTDVYDPDSEDGPHFGPEAVSDELRARLIAGEGVRFRAGETPKGRDTIVYYEGTYLGSGSHRHTPLIEHALPWAGATWIEYEHAGRWMRLRRDGLPRWYTGLGGRLLRWITPARGGEVRELRHLR
jgi:hypothetical protein